MSKTREVLGDVGSYSASLMMTQFVTLAAAILMRRFLGPTQTGIWSFVQVLLSYSEYASLGLLSAVTFRVPFYRGKGDHAKVLSIQNTVFSFSILTSAILSLGILIYAWIQRGSLSLELSIGLLFAVVLIFLQRTNGLLVSLVRAYKLFALAGRQMFLSAIVNAILIALLSYYFKLYGFMLAMCLSFLFNIVYIFAHQKFDLRWSISRDELFSLIKYGFPLMIVALLTTFFETIDRIMITKYLGFEALGFYGIGLMTFNYINSIPNAFSIVTIPNLQEKYGVRESKEDLKSFLSRSNYLVSGMIALLIGLAWFLIPALVDRILPKFAQGVDSMRILILSTFFIGLGQAYLQFIYVIKKHMVLLPFTALACGVAFLLNWFAIKAGLGIQGVAYATTAAIFLNFTAMFVYASLQVYSVVEIFRTYGMILLKFAIMIMLLLALTRCIATPYPMATVATQTFLFVAAYFPFMLASNKQYGLIGIIKQRIFR